jgi:DNA-binding HxlR family transcriptional regulator
METAKCPYFEEGIDIISQRWVALIVYNLLDGSKRFKQLEESMGISASVLSERLKLLEKQAILKRVVYPETPVRIEYELTDKGVALGPVFDSLMLWTEEFIKA